MSERKSLSKLHGLHCARWYVSCWLSIMLLYIYILSLKFFFFFFFVLTLLFWCLIFFSFSFSPSLSLFFIFNSNILYNFYYYFFGFFFWTKYEVAYVIKDVMVLNENGHWLQAIGSWPVLFLKDLIRKVRLLVRHPLPTRSFSYQIFYGIQFTSSVGESTNFLRNLIIYSCFSI